MAELRLGRFRHDSAGIRAIFTGAGMQAAVREATESLASQANSMASAHHVRHKPVTQPAYVANVKVGHSTAMGTVKPATPDGHLDQAIYHTLDSVNH